MDDILWVCLSAEAHFQWPVTRQKTLIISNLHFNKKRKEIWISKGAWSDPKNRWDSSWHRERSQHWQWKEGWDEVRSPNIMTLLSHPARANASMPLKNAQKLRQIERQLFFAFCIKKPNKIQLLTNSFLTWKIQFKVQVDLTLWHFRKLKLCHRFDFAKFDLERNLESRLNHIFS